jgi:hypothetical protein
MTTAIATLSPLSSPPLPFSPLRPYQAPAARAIIDSVLNRRGLTFTVVMARQAGKNELSARVETYLLVRNVSRAVDGIKCAPTFVPQAQVSMSRLWTRVIESGLGEVARRGPGNAISVGRARMLFLSAEPGANVVGHTAALVLEADEAQDIDAEKFDREFRPMAAATGTTIAYYGTPWDDSSLLERAVQHNLELQRRDGVQRHFTADWTEVAQENPAYARFVEGERDRLGESHPLFLTQYALRTVPGAGRLFSAAQRAQLAGTHPRRHSAAEGETYVAGLDIGGQDAGGPSGNDATVLTVARYVDPPAESLVDEPRLEIVEHIALTGIRHDELLGRLADVLGRTWRVSRVCVDATGLGETIARFLQRALGESTVRPFKFTTGSKSSLGYDLIAAVNGGRLRAYAADGSAEHAEFWRQVELARATYRPGRRLNFYVDPADGHDDYLSSLALVVAAVGDGVPRPRIARGRLN